MRVVARKEKKKKNGGGRRGGKKDTGKEKENDSNDVNIMTKGRMETLRNMYCEIYREGI